MPESGPDDVAQLGVLADDLERLERRLRGLSAAAWRSRAVPIRALLVDLVAIEAALRGTSPREVPGIAEFALADALAVIGGDVLDALGNGAGDGQLADALSTVRAALAATR